MPTMHLPHTLLGHDKIVIDDDDPTKRGELAEKVIGLIRNGHAIFLQKEDGSTLRIRGYDATDNSWYVDDAANPQKKRGRGRPKKVSAK